MKNRAITVVIVLISGLTAAGVVNFFAPKKAAPVENKKEVITPTPETAENEPEIVATATIQPSATDTPKPNATATPSPVKTIAPTPTVYVKIAAPASQRDEMINKICAVFGEKDCNQGIALATKYNPRLYPGSTFENAKYGLFAIRCDTVATQLGIDRTQPRADYIAECKAKLFDTNTSINIVHNYFIKNGYTPTELWLM